MRRGTAVRAGIRSAIFESGNFSGVWSIRIVAVTTSISFLWLSSIPPLRPLSAQLKGLYSAGTLRWCFWLIWCDAWSVLLCTISCLLGQQFPSLVCQSTSWAWILRFWLVLVSDAPGCSGVLSCITVEETASRGDCYDFSVGRFWFLSVVRPLESSSIGQLWSWALNSGMLEISSSLYQSVLASILRPRNLRLASDCFVGAGEHFFVISPRRSSKC